MSDRTVAEKLAAAKRKHKAYMKEKEMKSKLNRELEEKSNSENTNSPNEPVTNDIYESNMPLPQYSMDYINPNQGSNLPDPLSFFDNFSTVGAKIQNIAQPLASFFNPTNSIEEKNELPNQILIDDTVYQDDTSKSIPQNFHTFSYDLFQTNAVKDTQSSSINELNHLVSHNNYDQFMNSVELTMNSQNEFDKSPICAAQSVEPPGIDNYLTPASIQKLQTVSKRMEDYLNSGKGKTIDFEINTNVNLENTNYLHCNSELNHSNLITDFNKLQVAKNGPSITANENLETLREELNCHLQTISVLVSEKTELSALLDEKKTELHNATACCTDLQKTVAELKTYCSKLESDLESMKSANINQNSSQKEQHELYLKIKEDQKELILKNEELTQDLLESKEKLKNFTATNASLQKHVQELTSELSLANIKIQQLTLNETSEYEKQLEQLKMEKVEYEKRIQSLNESIKIMNNSFDDSNQQYQQYVEQQRDQLNELQILLSQIQNENEQLKSREEARIKHLQDIEKQLQHSQLNNNSSQLEENLISVKKELDDARDLVNLLRKEKEETSTYLTKLMIEKELLEKETETCKFSIGQLELTIEQLKGNQPDNAVLLATMESDKIAASLAISQNDQLKKQLDGMQEVLLKVNNDNVQLTEAVSFERQTNKDLFDKLQRTEISYQSLADAIEIKDKELVNLREKLEQNNKEVIQLEQLGDRLRHYEAQDHSSQSLQNELQESKRIIEHLTNEINLLKQNRVNDPQSINEDTSNDAVKELQTQLYNLQTRNTELETLLQHKSVDQKGKDTNGNEHLDKDTAMKHLEKKFLKTMEEIARLTEEKQRLEHIVLQLQGETETIGEYVTLYQQQRSILKQKTLEKDQQLEQLTNDRETIKANLDRLNCLIKKLITEKGAITKELMNEHHEFSKERGDLCAEHQKIHREINKITSDGLRNTTITDDPNTQIAEEIIGLLSEIKSSNLVQPVEGIHHCPWCSGQLITV